MKSIERALKAPYLNALTFARYRSFNPRRVRLSDCAMFLHVDPRDKRARKRLVQDPLRGRLPRNQRIWRAACAALSPDLAIDVGVNYGECLFTSRYGANTRAIGFEANTALRPYLDGSLAEHPDAPRIDLCFGLVGAEEAGDAEFFVDKDWSGGSTAAIEADQAKRYRVERIPTVTIDATIDRLAPGHPRRSLVFKIDVEGYEAKAMRGMERTLADAQAVIGLIEFDSNMLGRAGDDAASFLAWLQRGFRVDAFDREGKPFDATGLSLEQIGARLRRDHPHTDLLLTRGVDDQTRVSVLEGVTRR